MKVLEMLKKAGSKAGLIQVAEEVRTVEIKIVERKVVSLKQLETEAGQEDLSGPPPEITVGFDRVFEALNLPVPENGWTTDRVWQMLHSDELKSKPPKEAGEAILTAMGQNQVKPEDILRDAVNRDHALDSYEEFVDKKMKDRAAERHRQEEEFQERIRECQEEIRRMQEVQSREDALYREWQAKKVEKEEELARVASLFLHDHGITVGNNKKK